VSCAAAYDESEEDEIAKDAMNVVGVIVAHVLVQHAAQLSHVQWELMQRIQNPSEQLLHQELQLEASHKVVLALFHHLGIDLCCQVDHRE
jgi:hypothetical protein